ncbi:MAG: ATP-binding cassette domain-containing protein [Pseudomonadota bacterium]|nr:ATP-binding cassette domain-containing protein [Pseudomonadota bacterium]
MIKIENLHKYFENKKVLNGVNLQIEEGTSSVIIGGSGTGKSVLIKCILGLLTPEEGRISIKNNFIFETGTFKSNNKIRIGMLFQGGALFDSLRIWQNVSFYNIQKGKSKKFCFTDAILNLEKVGLNKDVVNLYPSELSGGMQKRVALARAISIKPDIIFFDEPTTGLDPISADVINKLILEKVRDIGATSLTITHDMSSARTISDKIHMLHKGQIIWEGNKNSIENTDNPFVLQFINGLSEGPIN